MSELLPLSYLVPVIPGDFPKGVPEDFPKGASAESKTFEPFRKIPRLSREIVITEKIDGTNGQIYITPETSCPESLPDIPWVASIRNIRVAAGSRNRWITPGNDNYGFAKWVQAHAEELLTLGPGRHYGEYWGAGIQRGYGLSQIGYGIPDRRFSLFNVNRWTGRGEDGKYPEYPVCCSIVPVLYRGVFDTAKIDQELDYLRCHGSLAAPGYMQPEGIVIYHTAAKTMFKKTIEKDEEPKGKVIPITL